MQEGSDGEVVELRDLRELPENIRVHVAKFRESVAALRDLSESLDRATAHVATLASKSVKVQRAACDSLGAAHDALRDYTSLEDNARLVYGDRFRMLASSCGLNPNTGEPRTHIVKSR